ncbi:MAG: hydantoinase/oxoprolinase family protein [Candidatus Korobacteraceae bacterium]
MTATTSKSSQPPLRVAIDAGGTFTDCVWMEHGKLRMTKVFSTPDDPSQAIAEALLATNSSVAIVLLHGTTVGTNTLLQRTGAKVAFVTTAGFEDIIEIGRQNRPKLYDLMFERVPPLVVPDMRFGLAERVAPEGKILLRPLSEDLRALARDVHASGAEAIAVSTLFSFANSENERVIGRVLEELGLPLSLSHIILPEFREYERASTVVVNAYLQPVMQGYLQRLDTRLRRDSGKTKSRVFVMQSSGGITSLESASRQPVRTVLSGPAGGVVGAAAMARHSGFERVITFDMGGTSTDVALVVGDPKPGNEAEIAGLPVRVPMLDIHTVGAGGGSLARFDAGGALRVGPESAGAVPGPICYGSGTQPTVTDANLLLGRLQPDKFLGGTCSLDRERTRAVTSEWLKQQGVRMSLEQFADGVIRVVNANMERALRVVSIERGYDPREFVLVAFGGAGGLHACDLAQALGIPRLLVPAMPGALSAYGILASDIVRDYSRTVVLSMGSKPPTANIRRQLEALEQRATQEFRGEGWTGKIHFERSADLRYRGQGFELNVRFSPALVAEFHSSHHARYGYSHPEREVELVTLRLRARMTVPQPPLTRLTTPQRAIVKPQKRAVWFSGKASDTAIYERHDLRPGRKYRGPAIVTEFSATTAIPPGTAFLVDKAGNLLLEFQAKQKAPRRAPSEERNV